MSPGGTFLSSLETDTKSSYRCAVTLFLSRRSFQGVSKRNKRHAHIALCSFSSLRRPPTPGCSSFLGLYQRAPLSAFLGPIRSACPSIVEEEHKQRSKEDNRIGRRSVTVIYPATRTHVHTHTHTYTFGSFDPFEEAGWTLSVGSLDGSIDPRERRCSARREKGNALTTVEKRRFR